MAAMDGLTFEGTFNSVTVGKFKDNTTNDIIELYARELVTAIRESYLNRLDDAESQNFQVSTGGGTLTLDFSAGESNALYRDICFYGSASFATAKSVAMSNDSRALRFDFGIQITNVAATLDFGSGSVFKSNASDFDAGSQVFTPSDIGFILITGTKIGSNWWLEFKYGFA